MHLYDHIAIVLLNKKNEAKKRPPAPLFIANVFPMYIKTYASLSGPPARPEGVRDPPPSSTAIRLAVEAVGDGGDGGDIPIYETHINMTYIYKTICKPIHINKPIYKPIYKKTIYNKTHI